MNHKERSQRMKLILLSILAVQLAAAWSMPQLAAAPSDHKKKDDNGPVQVGYVVVTPKPTTESPSTDIAVFETFGEHRGGQTQQAGVLPSAMTTHAELFVNASGRLSRNLGVAIANPDPKENATVTLTLYETLYDDEGNILPDYATPAHPSVTFPVDAGMQVAKYVTELFESHSEISRDFIGTLELVSDVPVAVIGIRTRGENFSTLPATSLSDRFPVPPIKIDEATTAGGPDAIILAHYAVGGGWTTEIVISNYGDSDANVRVDLFDHDGNRLEVELNGKTDSSFPDIQVPAHKVAILAPRDQNGDSGL